MDYSYHTMEGETKALSDISFHVNSGEFFVLSGRPEHREVYAAFCLLGFGPERGDSF
ncbi:hypothetical protein [Hungatella sp.]|uniref:hypothetical protein n=1 Tax=Hungatella sp. TaxID=2613924 RepID=UPI0039927A13